MKDPLLLQRLTRNVSERTSAHLVNACGARERLEELVRAGGETKFVDAVSRHYLSIGFGGELLTRK
jgi:hypothetical protein